MNFYYIIPLLASLLFFGCSSTYNLSNFPSKEKFFEDFNNSAKDKSLKIILNNDSTFFADYGAKISNDSLFIVSKRALTEGQIINKAEITAIEYGVNDMPSTIILTNGKTVEAKRMKILLNSIVVLNLENNYESLPLNKVVKISYKDHDAGVLNPAIIGSVAGIGLGALAGYALSFMITGPQLDYRSSSQEESLINLGIIVGPVIGFITGAIIGYIVGHTYAYEFNYL